MSCHITTLRVFRGLRVFGADATKEEKDQESYLYIGLKRRNCYSSFIWALAHWTSGRIGLSCFYTHFICTARRNVKFLQEKTNRRAVTVKFLSQHPIICWRTDIRCEIESNGECYVTTNTPCGRKQRQLSLFMEHLRFHQQQHQSSVEPEQTRVRVRVIACSQNLDLALYTWKIGSRSGCRIWCVEISAYSWSYIQPRRKLSPSTNCTSSHWEKDRVYCNRIHFRSDRIRFEYIYTCFFGLCFAFITH